MRASEYCRLAEKTNLDERQYGAASIRAQVQVELLHAILGINTEAGELTDALKKYILYNKPIDVVNLKEEIGDIMWYIAIACNELEVSLEEIFDQNIAKLKARYGDKFTEQAALNRDLPTERKILEG